MSQKKALAVHDISCTGRCSLTVALPILSASGADCAIIPTAVLSTHTGGFTGYTFHDLTCEINPIVDHWATLNMHFDAIYTGYLGSLEQTALVGRAIDTLGSEDTVVVIDPVMGDHGALYPGFAPDFPMAMKELCHKADIIVPNFTEAALMLGREYRPGPYTHDEVLELCRALSAIHNGRVVLTGVHFNDKELGAAVYDPATDLMTCCMSALLPFSMHGTGDVFASALTSALLAGLDLIEAAKVAVEYTTRCMKTSNAVGGEVRFGPCFELELPWLIRRLGLL